MKLETIHIKNPSQGLLNLVRKLQAEKEAKTKAVLADMRKDRLKK